MSIIRAGVTVQVPAVQSRVYSGNWPMRVKWAPFCNYGGPFSKKESPPKGILHGSNSPDALPPFWNILGN